MTSLSENSSDDWWSIWEDPELLNDPEPVSSSLSNGYTLCEDELRALAEAEDQAYDELIRECTEEVFHDQRDGAGTPPLKRPSKSLE